MAVLSSKYHIKEKEVERRKEIGINSNKEIPEHIYVF